MSCFYGLVLRDSIFYTKSILHEHTHSGIFFYGFQATPGDA